MTECVYAVHPEMAAEMGVIPNGSSAYDTEFIILKFHP